MIPSQKVYIMAVASWDLNRQYLHVGGFGL